MDPSLKASVSIQIQPTLQPFFIYHGLKKTPETLSKITPHNGMSCSFHQYEVKSLEPLATTSIYCKWTPTVCCCEEALWSTDSHRVHEFTTTFIKSPLLEVLPYSG